MLKQEIKKIDQDAEGQRAEAIVQRDMVHESAGTYLGLPLQIQKQIFKQTRPFNGQNTPILAMAGDLVDHGKPLSKEEKLAINGVFRHIIVIQNTQLPKN